MGEIASPSQLRMSFLRWAVVLVPLVLLLGIASGRLSNAGYGNPWFDALDKPAIMPPGWMFAVVWAVLYILLGFALAMIVHARRARGRGLAIALFAAQFVLNLAWSPLFFAAHQVTAAFWLIVAILLLSLVAAILFARIRIVAGLLLVPYLAWLMFAALLNHEVDRLNPDAELLAPEGPSTQIVL